MDKKTKECIFNEKLVEIAFRIALDRISRKAPKQKIRVLNTKRLNLSHNLSTSRCIRTFTYHCNESDPLTARTPSSRASSSRDRIFNNKLDHKVQPEQQQLHNPPKPAIAPLAADAERPLKEAAINATPQEQSDWGRYYMRTDTRSRDTVLACHNSINSPRSAETSRSRKQPLSRNLVARRYRIPKKRSTSSTSSSCGSCSGSGSGICNVNASANGSGREETGQSKAHHFHVKIDQEHLGRALHLLSVPEFPTELLVDVNCSTNCRVSGVSITQNPSSKQCVLSLKVDSGDCETTSLQQPADAQQTPNPQLVSCGDDRVVKVADKNSRASSVAKTENVPAEDAAVQFYYDGDAQAVQSLKST